MDTTPLQPGEVAALRQRFPILRTCTYLINNSLGAMPASVETSLAGYAHTWATRGVRAWSEVWLPEVRRVTELLGELIGAPQGSVVVHQNVATLMAIALSGLHPARRRVVVADDEWPGHLNLLRQLTARGDLEVVEVRTGGAAVDRVADAEALCAAIDESTAAVIASHVDFRTSAIRDVAAVCAAAHAAGAVAIVDGYHATGHMPVDVAAMGCDVYLGGSVKWLCGGPGVGYAYVRPGAQLTPAAVGWLGHERPFDFDAEWAPAAGAMGWLGGTPGIPALYAAREGYAVIAEVGPGRIRATSTGLTQRLVDGALERGFAVSSPHDPDRRAGAVSIDIGDEPAAVEAALGARGIIVDARPGVGIRVGPHVFSTAAEVDILLAALGDLARE